MTRLVPDRVMRGLARLLIHVFFSRVETEDLHHVSGRGPVIVVANHLNGLVDGLLLIATMPRYPRFLGKATLFRIAPLWPFLHLAGVVPVYRAQDRDGTARNAEAFRQSRALLAAAGVLAVFPEGISHNEPSTQPLRTGTARIALGAAVDDAVGQVSIVPVGLVYDRKARFRSRALVRAGNPVVVSGWAHSYRSDERAAVRSLTDQVAGELASVSPSYQSWTQAAELGRIAGLAASLPSGGVDGRRQFARRERIAQRLATLERTPAGASQVARLRCAFRRYERALGSLGVSDDQLLHNQRPARRGRSIGWSLAKLVAAAPFAALGTVIHLVPYELIKAAAGRATNEGMKATVKLLGCFASFTVVYLLLAAYSVAPFGVLGAAGVLIACPACGYLTVRFAERVRSVGGLIAGYRALKGRRHTIDSVLQHRSVVAYLLSETLRRQ